MSPTDPKVSVIMATYNCEATIEAALDSILNQTYPNWELVVCDDGSTDGTPELLAEAKGRFGSRLIVLRNASNMKLPFSLNRCLEVASGELIARMDGDDLSEPERFERQVDFLRAKPAVHLVGTAMRRFNNHGVVDVIHPAAPRPDKWTLGRGSSVPFFHATIMARTEVFQGVGNYTVSWRTERGQDVDLWFKFFNAGYAGENLPDPLYRVREDEGAIRRRTARARWGGYVTRIKGYRSLGYPPGPYLRSTVNLMKIFVPARVFVLHRAYRAWRWNRESATTRPGATG